MQDFDIWLVINESGDYEVGPDRNLAEERFADHIGGDESTRVIRIGVKASLPCVVNLPAVTVPDEE